MKLLKSVKSVGKKKVYLKGRKKNEKGYYNKININKDFCWFQLIENCTTCKEKVTRN
jgi:hypothetical protein